MIANSKVRGWVAVLLVVSTAGCANMGGRSWGMCALGGGLIGAAAGGGGGAAIENNHHRRWSTWGRGAASIATGALVGAAIGALAGHFICDPEVVQLPGIPKPPPPPPMVILPPPPPPKPAPGTKIVTLHGPNFDFDKATLRPDGKAILDDGVATMKENPTLRVAIEGHTDSVGSAEYNQRLSERRAQTVREYFVSRGIDPSRIVEVRGFGKTKPVASNSTKEGRAENRRVEVIAQ